MKRQINDRGEARIIIIMCVIVIALLVAIFVPIGRNLYEDRMVALDEEYIATAQRMAKENYLNTTGEDAVWVFDSVNKKFVDTKSVNSVEPYANAKIHKDKYLVVTITTGGEISTEWLTIEEIKKRD